jgi:hypothetical protein
VKQSIPWLTLGIGLLLSLLLLQFGPLNTNSGYVLPLLTALLMSEFGFIITAIGAGISVSDMLKPGIKWRPITLLIGNLLLAMYFMNRGFVLWAETGGLGP